MRVLLKETGTSKFVQRPSEWTEQAENARAFGGLTEALFYCYNHQLTNVEIFWASEDDQLHWSMPLPDLD